jgi:hypothetical protein
MRRRTRCSPISPTPDKMIVWKALEATLDPRPGGVFWIDVTGRDVARGEYLEIDPCIGHANERSE